MSMDQNSLYLFLLQFGLEHSPPPCGIYVGLYLGPRLGLRQVFYCHWSTLSLHFNCMVTFLYDLYRPRSTAVLPKYKCLFVHEIFIGLALFFRNNIQVDKGIGLCLIPILLCYQYCVSQCRE